MPQTPAMTTMAKAQALIADARNHLALLEAERRNLMARLEHRSDKFSRLEATRERLARELMTVEAVVAGALPGRPAQTRPPPPPELAGLRFAGTLGPTGQKGAISSGPEVERLQQVLRWQGADLPTDGQFSPHTRVALVAWQKKHGLPGDGILGAATRRALNEMLARQG